MDVPIVSRTRKKIVSKGLIWKMDGFLLFKILSKFSGYTSLGCWSDTEERAIPQLDGKWICARSDVTMQWLRRRYINLTSYRHWCGVVNKWRHWSTVTCTVLCCLTVELCRAIPFQAHKPTHFWKEEEISFLAVYDSSWKRQVGLNTEGFKIRKWFFWWYKFQKYFHFHTTICPWYTHEKIENAAK